MTRPAPTYRCACITIGELERAAGIGPDPEARWEFWRDFAPLGAGAFPAARAEIERRILAHLGRFQIPPQGPYCRRDRNA